MNKIKWEKYRGEENGKIYHRSPKMKRSGDAIGVHRFVAYAWRERTPFGVSTSPGNEISEYFVLRDDRTNLSFNFPNLDDAKQFAEDILSGSASPVADRIAVMTMIHGDEFARMNSTITVDDREL